MFRIKEKYDNSVNKSIVYKTFKLLEGVDIIKNNTIMLILSLITLSVLSTVMITMLIMLISGLLIFIVSSIINFITPIEVINISLGYSLLVCLINILYIIVEVIILSPGVIIKINSELNYELNKKDYGY